MESQLELITRKIYDEGVQKAKKEKEEILAQAKKEADAMILEAEKEAKALIAHAEKDAAQLSSKMASEVRMASSQALSLLKQEIVDLLSGMAMTKEIQKVFEDSEYTKKMLSDMLAKADFSGEDVDVSLTLPEKYQQEILEFFKTKAKNVLESGVEVRFQSRMDGGFKIGPKDHHFVLSFSDRDFIQYFQSFLKPKAKEILFPGVDK